MLTYIKDGRMIGNNMFMDPHIGQAENGNNIYNTKEYFKELAKSNNGLVKGFFEQNSVNAMETNYIGSIGKDENGKPNRNLDHAFVKKYKRILESKKEKKIIEAEARTKMEDDKFKSSLKEGTQSGYQNWCDNMDRNNRQMLEHNRSESDIR